MTNEYLRRIQARIKLSLIDPLAVKKAHAKSLIFQLPWANVGQRHPHYGMTQAEHFAAKAA